MILKTNECFIQKRFHNSSSALPTFFKWFKKASASKSNGDQKIISKKSSGTSLAQFSSSSSCDSIISTSTTGFAYIKPNNYKPDGISNQRKLFLDTEFESDTNTIEFARMKSYRRSDNLCLRKKYNLFDAYSLKSNNYDDDYNKSDETISNSNNEKYLNLKTLTDSSNNCNNNNNRLRRHRRTVSDSCKEKRSGAYIHVKGKRRAPQPPLQASGDQIYQIENTISSSSLSTLNKKKRKAPAPPPILAQIKLPSENGIDELIKPVQLNGDCNVKKNNNEKNSNSQRNSIIIDNKIEIYSPKLSSNHNNSENKLDINPASKLSENQKNIIMEKVIESQRTKPNENNTSSNKNPDKQGSPILSPRPWYKRSISSNRDSSIPFKREVVLKTMEKRKQNIHNKDSTAASSDVISNSRPSSFFDGGHKFGFFLRHKDHSNGSGKSSKDKEKRKSGIGIPNISELDREAAEIVEKEKSNLKNAIKINEQLILQQEMFNNKSECKKIFDLKENKLYLNSSYDEHNDDIKSKSSQPLNSTIFDIRASETNTFFPENNEVKLQSFKKKLEEPEIKDFIPKLSWTCPVCTLENPSWRIMCDACEKLKPFEKFIASSFQNNNSNKDEKEISNNNNDKLNLNNSLERETTNENYQISNDSSLKNSENNLKTSIELLSPENNDIKKPLLDSSVIITTVTPVFYATTINKNENENNFQNEISSKIDEISLKSNEKTPQDNKEKPQILNLKEIRNARISKFSVKGNINNLSDQDESSLTNNNEDLLNDPNYLELEKKRLRDKIRAMNARALTEKYPILKKNTSSTENDSSTSVSQNPIFEENIEKNETLSTSNIHNIQNIEKDDFKTQQFCKVSQGAVKKLYYNNRNVLNTDETNLYELNTKESLLKPKKISSSAQTSKLITNRELFEFEDEKLINNDVCHLTKNKNDAVNEKNPTENNKLIKKNYNLKEIKEKQEEIFNSTENNITADENINLVPINFSSSLMLSANKLHRTDTITLNKIMRDLELAIVEGNHEFAAQLATNLAKMKISLQVTKSKCNNNNDSTYNNKKDDQKQIIAKVSVFIQGKSLQQRTIELEINPKMSIFELKQKTFDIFNIPIELQKWLINDELIDDDNIILEYYKVDKLTKFHLDLIPINNKNDIKSNIVPKKANCDEIYDFINDIYSTINSKFEENEILNDISVHGEDDYHGGATALTIKNDVEINKSNWECPLCTLINSFNNSTCNACSKVKPKNYLNEKEFHDSEKLNEKKQNENKNDLNKSNSNRKSAEIFNIIDEAAIKIHHKTKIPILPTQFDNNNLSFHISSPNITKYKYRGVDNFNPNRKNPYPETPIVKKEIQIKKQKENYQPLFPLKSTVKTNNETLSIQETSKNQYSELLNLENSDIVLNIEDFECPICFIKYEPGEGIILRDCLHIFCKECLVNTVRYCDEAEIQCPYMNSEYSCESVLQEREIKAIVPNDVYELHLAKSLQVAEHKIENTFHCKTPNCRGWCIYEDNVNQFKCPLCTLTNCLTCRVIHDGLTCKQYQDRLDSDCDSNVEARRTKEMLSEMVEKGEAMNCPTCQVILMKKWGCDWLKCSMCKTEICWVTRGSRWGPGGKGDITAGCKCGVNGLKCHPKCNYCH